VRGLSRVACVLVLAALPLSAAAPVAPMPRPVAARQPAPDAGPVIEGDESAEYMAEVRVRGVPAGTAVIWFVSPESAGVKTRVVKSEKAFLLAGPPGDYTVRAWLVKGEDSTELKKPVRLTGGAPAPPKPVPPGPGPAPAPVPEVDPLLTPAQIAYTADPSAAKAADKAALAAVFRVLADATAAPEVKTAGNLFDLVHGAIEARIDGRLKTVRTVLGAELAKVLPAQNGAALTQQNRDDAAKQLRRFATVLEGVK
jgi:hypothetical protein